MRQFKNTGINVLSLFDGMSCGRIALERAGIKVNQYFASEIDPYAITVTKANWPETRHLGSVSNWRNWNLPKIDMIIAGSPCQGFSFAGKQLAFDDPRSKLFFEFIACLRFYKPKWFLLENVNMKKSHLKIITDLLEVYPKKMNSSLVSAQNRVRWYWANWEISEPEDRHIYLQDIIEDGYVDRKKSYCIDASYHKGGNVSHYLNKSRRQIVFKKNYVQLDSSGKGYNSQNDCYFYLDGKHGTLKAHGRGHTGVIFKPKYRPCAMVGRRVKNGKRTQDRRVPVEQYIEVSASNKARCVTTVQKDSMVATGAMPGRYSVGKINDGLIEIEYRSLTVAECEKLQTVDVGYTNHVSKTQRYTMLGNGWTVDMVAHFFRNLLSPPAPKGQQLLF